MNGQDNPYNGYQDTNTIRILAGFRSERYITDDIINQAIKGAEEKINDETNLKWYPYNNDPQQLAPYIIREICKLYAIALLRNVYPDDQDTYQKNVNLADALLAKFIGTNITVQSTGGTGSVVVSEANADTNNPDAAPDLSSKSFSRDYMVTYL
jgi:hypothetical protein